MPTGQHREWVQNNPNREPLPRRISPVSEISCPTKYFKEASSISFSRSVTYGLKVLAVSLKFRLQRWHVAKFDIFAPESSPIDPVYYEPAK
jgi:hypothetical protein